MTLREVLLLKQSAPHRDFRVCVGGYKDRWFFFSLLSPRCSLMVVLLLGLAQASSLIDSV